MNNKQQISILDTFILEEIRLYEQLPTAELAHTAMNHPTLFTIINSELTTSYDRALGWSVWYGQTIAPISRQPIYRLITRRLKSLKNKGIIKSIPNGWSREGGTRRATNWTMAY